MMIVVIMIMTSRLDREGADVDFHPGWIEIMTIMMTLTQASKVIMIMTSRLDREGEAEVCSERDTHHPVAALAW